jgi:3-carboxy-cis,cis-muconate cycloisomerase
VSVSPFDHPLLSGLLGDEEIAGHFTVAAELGAMADFERALALAEAAEGIIPAEAAGAIADRIATFQPDVDGIRAATARDGVVGVDYVRQLRSWVGEPHAGHVHHGATSQDVVDTALVLRLRAAVAILAGRLEAVEAALAQLAGRFAGRSLMGRTRMQDALPITVGDRIAAWRGPFQRHRQRLEELRPRLLAVQFGGAVGTLDKLGGKGREVVRRMAAELGLAVPERSWHTQRDSLAEFAAWLALVTGSLGKIGADIGLMAQSGPGEIALAGGGGSSAMPHKANPVGAEVLVALARFVATLSGGMAQALVAEQERSGAAWTLEWMLLPQMVVATAAALRTAGRLIGDVTSMGSPG